MRHLKKFENYKVNESVAAATAAFLIGTGVIWLAGQVYDKAKKFWSKHVIAEKYTPTGKVEIVTTNLPKNVAYTIPLSDEERNSGVVKTTLTQYKDDLGNVYWGYDHLHTENEYADSEEQKADLDMYTAMFKEEDYNTLKNFLQDSERYSGKGGSRPKPTPIEMIYREDWNVDSF